MSEELNICAISIPHTKRHIKFIEEVETALGKFNVPFRSEVDEGGRVSQESWVRFFTDDANESKLQDLVKYISKKPL